jgi:hypothetical protein
VLTTGESLRDKPESLAELEVMSCNEGIDLAPATAVAELWKAIDGRDPCRQREATEQCIRQRAGQERSHTKRRDTP